MKIFLATILLFLLAVIGKGHANSAITTVASDGSGDYPTIQSAVDAAPTNATGFHTLLIKEGVYKENLTIPAGKTHLHFKGGNADRTIITFDNYSAKIKPDGEKFGTSGSASVFIKANHFKAENLTFQNTAGMDAGQALAVNISGNFAAFRQCKFLGGQDTFYAAEHTAQYLKDCYIAGTVDFIFGGSTAFFENCTLHSLRNGYITAASTPEDQKYGYVFMNCKLTGDPAPATVYLGRPWRPHAKVVFLNCEMAGHIKPEGWNNWGKSANEATAFYAEFQSTGAGGGGEQRQPWSRQLDPEQAKNYSREQVLGDWNPF